MGDGHFGGDGSVAWEVRAGHVRVHDDVPDGPKGHKQTGIDETEADPGSFEIEIKLPTGAADQAELLTYFTPKAQQGGKIKFSLPIESGQTKQVKIAWKSRLVANVT